MSHSNRHPVMWNLFNLYRSLSIHLMPLRIHVNVKMKKKEKKKKKILFAISRMCTASLQHLSTPNFLIILSSIHIYLTFPLCAAAVRIQFSTIHKIQFDFRYCRRTLLTAASLRHLFLPLFRLNWVQSVAVVYISLMSCISSSRCSTNYLSLHCGIVLHDSILLRSQFRWPMRIQNISTSMDFGYFCGIYDLYNIAEVRPMERTMNEHCYILLL